MTSAHFPPWQDRPEPYAAGRCIHFRTADVVGTVIGKKVVHWMERNYFQPTS